MLPLFIAFFFNALGLLTADRDTQPCRQAQVTQPSNDLWQRLASNLMDETHRERVAAWLVGAIKIPTETFDDMNPIGNDSRWDIFASFHDYLIETFPLTFTSLSVTKVNTYGIVLAWEGSDLEKKPILLTAHQDVVPVDPKTLHQWTHPPYSGFNDGQRIWGRGASDDKNGLIGLLATIELLLEAKFRPSRSVVLAFGFDEESSGEEGASKIAPVLLELHGRDAFAMIVDEGDGFWPQYEAVVATPSISEKGYLDVKVEVRTPGGHSSIPPAHTSIGILSALLVELEEHPHPFHLPRQSPVFLTLRCLAAHSPGLPLDLRRRINMAAGSDEALRALELELSTHPIYGSLIQTTQAITMVQGGVKSNSLPEAAWALVNLRISTTRFVSVSETMSRIAGVLRPLATKSNLSFRAFDAEDSALEDKTTLGSLILSDPWSTALEPAPTTPTEIDAAPYALLASSIKATYNVYRNLTGDNIIVSPGIMSGNSDTRAYWNLSSHIFRYTHQDGANGALNGLHGVNEYISVDSLIEIVVFFTTLILNADESLLL